MTTKEQASREYCNKTGSMYFDYTDASNELIDAFIAGWDAGQKQFMENYISKKDHEIIVKEALSMGNKESQGLDKTSPETYLKLKRELAAKDEEIEKLKLHDIAGYQEGIDCLERELRQAKELFNGLREISSIMFDSLNDRQNMDWAQEKYIDFLSENTDKIKALLGEE